MLLGSSHLQCIVLLMHYVTHLVYDVIRLVYFLPSRICLNIPLEVNNASAPQHVNRKQHTRSAAPTIPQGEGGWMGCDHDHGRGRILTLEHICIYIIICVYIYNYMCIYIYIDL